MGSVSLESGTLDDCGLGVANLNVVGLALVCDYPKLWHAATLGLGPPSKRHRGGLVRHLVVWVPKAALAVVRDYRVWLEVLEHGIDVGCRHRDRGCREGELIEVFRLGRLAHGGDPESRV